MTSSRYKNLIDDLAIEIALAENEGKSEAVVKAIEKKVFRVQAQIDKIQAKGPTAAMETLEQAVKALGGVEKLTATQTQTLVRDIERLSRAGAAVPTSLEPAIASVNKMRLAQAATAAEAVKAAQAIEESNRRQAASLQNKQDLQDFVTSKMGLGTGVASLGAAAGGLLAVGAMAGAAKETYELIKASAELADTITDLAGTYQVSTDEIQTWQRIQKDTGVTVDAIGASVTAVSKLLVNSPDKFKEWGMDVEHLRSLQPEQLLGAMGEKLKSLNQTERLAFIEDFKIANELMPHLLSGFDALREKAAGSISPLSEAELENLKETKDAITGIETAWADMWLEIGNALGSDAQVQEFFSSIKDGIVELVRLIADNREELAFGAKMLASMATFDVVGAAKAVAQYSGAPTLSGVKEGLSRTFGRGRGYTDAGDGGGADALEGTSFSKAEADAWRAGQAALAAAEKKYFDELEAARKKAATEREAAKKRADAERAALQQESLRNQYDSFQRESAQLAADDAAAAKAAANKGKFEEEKRRLEAATLQFLSKGAEEATQKSFAGAFGKALIDLENLRDAEALQKRVRDELAALTDESGNLKYSQEEIDTILKKNVTSTMTWSQFLQTAANQLSAMGRSGQAIGKILGGVGGIGAMFEKGGALNGVKGIGDLFKGGTGQVLGKLAGGATAALAAFDIGKTLYSMFKKTEAQKVAFDIGRDWGTKISDGLAEAIAKDSKTIGREAASLKNADKIIAEAGGVQAFGVDKSAAKLRDLFSMVQTGKLTIEQARKPFDAVFGELAAASISKTSGLVSAQVMELMALNKQLGLGSEAITKFQDEQRGKATEILGRLLNNKDFVVSGQAAGTAYGNAVAAAYSRMLEQGLSGAEIAEKMGPQVDALRKKLEEAGVSGGAAFEGMAEKMAMFTSEVTGPTATALQDQISLMAALANAGDLSRDDFVAMAQSVGETFNQLQAKLTEEGKDPNGAFKGMQKDLQKLWEMQQRFGVAVDANTQGILDKASADGLIGPEFMDPVVSELVGIGDTLKVIARQGGASESDLVAGIPRGGAAFPQPVIPQLSTAGFAQAVSDAIRGGGSNSGSAAGLDLSAGSVSAIAAAMAAAVAGQPIDLNLPPMTMDGNVVAAGLQTRVERGTATGLVTAMHRKIKERE